MSFADDIESWTKGFNKNAVQAIENATVVLYDKIIEDSPVDTGYFKENWEQNIDPNKESILKNELPYAERLEFGHSDQAPRGMVRLNAENWDTILDNEFEKLDKK